MASHHSLRLLLALAFAAALPAAALAQPADLPIPAAKDGSLPAGISVIATPAGKVYADSRGRILYGMDMRALLRRTSVPSSYCREECLRDWEPLHAPKGSKPNIEYPRSIHDPKSERPAGMVAPEAAPDWTIIDGAEGPQWVYKVWHVVFTRRGAPANSTAFDGSDEHIWNTLKFVPPVPKLTAPMNVAARFIDQQYALTDADGRLLFTGRCDNSCAGWTPLTGGYASHGVGKWQLLRGGDDPQWSYAGRPVFVSEDKDPDLVPAGTTMLRP